MAMAKEARATAMLRMRFFWRTSVTSRVASLPPPVPVVVAGVERRGTEFPLLAAVSSSLR